MQLPEGGDFEALNCQYTIPHVRECEVECSINLVTRH